MGNEDSGDSSDYEEYKKEAKPKSPEGSCRGLAGFFSKGLKCFDDLSPKKLKCFDVGN